MNPVTTTTILLCACTFVCGAALVAIVRRGRDGMHLRAFLMVNFFVDYVLSGFAHTLHWSRTRGFYDALAGSPPGHDFELTTAGWSSLLGLCALVAGAWHTRSPGEAGHSPADDYSAAQRHRRLIAVLGFGLLAIVAAAVVKARSVVAALGSARVIAVAGGNARYVFLAGWLPAVMVVVGMVLMNRRTTRTALVGNAVLMLVLAGITAEALSFSGGRADALFNSIPLFALLLPRLGRLRGPMLALAGVALGVFVWAQTITRQTNSGGAPSSAVDTWGLVDWQWGRFSMISWAANNAKLHGLLHGETLVNAALVVPQMFAHFAGVTLPGAGFRSMVQITGLSYRGDDTSIFVVPGFLAEMYANFAMLGVVVSCFLLGRLTGLVADAYRDTRHETTRALLSVLGTVVAFGTLVNQFQAFFQNAIVGAMPLYGFMLLERWLARRDAVTTPRLWAPRMKHMVRGRRADDAAASVPGR